MASVDFIIVLKTLAVIVFVRFDIAESRYSAGLPKNSMPRFSYGLNSANILENSLFLLKHTRTPNCQYGQETIEYFIGPSGSW